MKVFICIKLIQNQTVCGGGSCLIGTLSQSEAIMAETYIGICKDESLINQIYIKISGHKSRVQYEVYENNEAMTKMQISDIEYWTCFE